LTAAQKVLQAGIARTAVVADGVQLGRIDPELEALRRDYAAYASAGMALVDAPTRANNLRTLEDGLSAGENTLNETIDRLAARLQSAESGESENVRSKEEQALPSRCSPSSPEALSPRW
jgi:hypothetical protein